MKKKTAAFASALFLVLSSHAFAGVLDTTLRAGPQERISVVNDRTLVACGQGIFRYMGFKLYAATFYAPTAGRSSEEVLADVSKRLVIHYFRAIPKDAIVEAAEKNLRNNPEVDYPKIRERVRSLHSRYTAVNKGDEYVLVYFQEKTYLYFNRKLQARIDGEDFAKAYFGIWLSKYSINQRLRKELLGVGE